MSRTLSTFPPLNNDLPIAPGQPLVELSPQTFKDATDKDTQQVNLESFTSAFVSNLFVTRDPAVGSSARPRETLNFSMNIGGIESNRPHLPAFTMPKFLDGPLINENYMYNHSAPEQLNLQVHPTQIPTTAILPAGEVVANIQTPPLNALPQQIDLENVDIAFTTCLTAK
ncbi:hypothetical protein HK098_004568 [Nowakowskiella sp. JEL0407]|nr:hypothetical protein HK098_004568 [Nowakowskiella sp. JEL0407]